jgi:hypothetical protein
MALTPGLQLPFGIQPVNPSPVDSWSGPYSASTLQGAIDSANAAIPSAIRYQTMEIRLIVNGVSKKYWYRDGTGDADLVEFSSGAGGGGEVDLSGYASLSGASFSGNVSAPSLSGSLTRLSDGSPYLVGGNGIQVLTGSNGSVEITLSSEVLTLDTLASSSNLLVGGDVVFSGDVLIEGTLSGGSPLEVETPSIFHEGLSGSLTRLADGSPYLVAGSGILISTGSSGQITIASTSGGDQTRNTSGVLTELVLNESPTGLIDGFNREFTLSADPANPAGVMMWLNGQLLTQGTERDFSVSGRTISFAGFSPDPSDILICMYQKAVTVKQFALNESASIISVSGSIGVSLNQAPNPAQSLMLFMNGQLLTQNTDYALSGSSVQFLAPFVNSEDIFLATYSYVS